jgi:hypothetical protein
MMQLQRGAATIFSNVLARVYNTDHSVLQALLQATLLT